MLWLADLEMGDTQLRTIIVRLVLDRWGLFYTVRRPMWMGR
jgi:hypothetical protein